MKNYVAPSLVEFGKSSHLIKGNCGWGTENAYFDKTGYYTYYAYQCTAPKTCGLVSICTTSQPPDTCSSPTQC